MKTKTILKKTPVKKSEGPLYPPDSMFFRIDAGEAKSGKKVYELSTNVGGGTPIVRSKTTGKWFALSWRDILDQAVAAGIDA